MRKLREFTRLLAWFLPTFLLLPFVGGQPEGDFAPGQVRGRVYEESAVGIPGVRVILKNNSTGLTRSTIADGAGSFAFAKVEPGVYGLTVDKEGYERTAQSTVEVKASQVSYVHLRLKAMLSRIKPAVLRKIAVLWQNGRPTGSVAVTNGSLAEMTLEGSRTSSQGAERFACGQTPCRLELTLGGSGVRFGKGSTLVTVRAEENPFSFFLEDVDSRYPIYIPAYGVVVTEGKDGRSYSDLVSGIRSRGLQTNLQQINSEPEENFPHAAEETRTIKSQTWLGLSRDFRIFAVGERLDWIEPRFHAYNPYLPEKTVRYDLLMGRGWGARDRIDRRLDEGRLPILLGSLIDDDIHYQLTAFVTLEKSRLIAGNVRGTHFLVGEGYGYTDDVRHPAPLGMRPWPERFKQMFPGLLREEMAQEEQTVLMMRVEMLNTAPVPRHAWFRNPVPRPAEYRFDPNSGFGFSSTGEVFSISTLDGEPLPSGEVSPLLKPGQTSVIEIFIPHRPIPRERAIQLASSSFPDRLQECRRFWQEKLSAGATIRLPEARIEEMIQAGLLHLDLVTYGREPDGILAPSVGVYTPIGSESSPIIQFFDSMGWHDVARRALMFFFEKQHEDGHMQNYGDYEIETAGALYTAGEHYRYTRDDEWVRQIKPNLLKACEYILKLRQLERREELRGRGYGMIVGKVADPQDRVHNFMFNGYQYIALARTAEMLARTDPTEARRLAGEAEAFRKDIRDEFLLAMAESPVMPLRDGSWCPTAPPWAEYRGPLALYAKGGEWYTHGAMNARESLGGPMWLVPHEVLGPEEPATTFLLNFHHELLTQESVAFSQPYYSQHQYVHLRRQEPKAFLAAYYRTLASLADRETYTFFEHFMGGPHKTHEEANFLMQTRWMLYQEKGDTLDLLAGAPRTYFEPGKMIELDNVASYFGPVSLQVQSDLTDDRISATVACNSERRPKRVTLRVAHPLGRRPVHVSGGTYDYSSERVLIEPFTGQAKITVVF